ncbi:nuclear factor 7, ovary-like [Protopterus annectens]|uniref:nuclear factor 7, ovary-like n=1 Tax=Protopterus annectens TaxID=7888 RepID=UPI001CFA1585|nr:nuclear factor 7, ovary-like [Protopterus annectens]
MLNCMRHFCKSCIRQLWKSYSSSLTCPQCRWKFPIKAFCTNFLVAPKIFIKSVNVLNTGGFISGSHYLEDWVGTKTKWDIGVAQKSANKKTKVKLGSEDGYWIFRLRNDNEYIAAS